jgi:hypothetical protein
MQISERNIARMLRMDLPELVFRGKQETFKWADRIRVSRAAAVRMDADQQRLNRFLANCQQHFFEGAFDSAVVDEVRSASPDGCQTMLIGAHHAARGRFDLLGYRGLEFGDPIDWHLDPVAGRRAPLVHWSLIDPLDCTTLGDSKVIWELNRHQWLVQLAQAWRMTGDARYAQRVVQSIRAWLRMNPTGMGINWASSLEVAFRLVSWIWALVLIRDSGALTGDVFVEIERAAEAHAAHVERYLSYYFSPNTHLTGEAIGLLYAGVVFRDLKHAERWRALATRILVGEAERQILADGVYFERSTCYQRYTADIYLHFLILASRSGIEVPAVVTNRLKSLIDVLINLRQPDGSMPSIGDADDGMLLPLSTSAPNDYSSTFSTAAVVFRNPVYAWAAGRLAADTLWLAGTRAKATFEGLDKKEPQSSVCRAFPVGGFVSMRSGWDERSHALVFDGGPLGCDTSAGHGHADLLSIQCSAFGERYLVDAGTCCYTADLELRNFFRSTAAHSTITLDGISQAEPAGPFSWANRCTAHLLRWKSDEHFAYADALNDAYKRLADRVTHRRRVVFVHSRYWVVIDDVCGSNAHRVDLRFQFAPMQVHAIDSGWVRATRDGRRGLLVRPFASAPVKASVREGLREPMEGWISTAYGQMEPAPVLVFSAATQLPMRIITVLWPAENTNTVPDIEVIRDEKGRLTGVRTDSESVTFDDDEIYVRHCRNH